MKQEDNYKIERREKGEAAIKIEWNYGWIINEFFFRSLIGICCQELKSLANHIVDAIEFFEGF